MFFMSNPNDQITRIVPGHAQRSPLKQSGETLPHSPAFHVPVTCLKQSLAIGLGEIQMSDIALPGSIEPPGRRDRISTAAFIR